MITRLVAEGTALFLIDVQEKFVPTLFEPDRLLRNCGLLIEGAKLLGLPILATEQYPEKLGRTLPELSKRIPDFFPVAKLTFSACAPAPIQKKLKERKVKQLLLCGIETHVCVMQTALDALEAGLQVFVAQDAVTSRTEFNWRAGLERLARAGADLMTTEMVLFEMLKTAGTDPFKKIGQLVR